jgi:hypothetical protein
MSHCTGDPSNEPAWLRAQDQAAAMFQEQFPDGCGLCGEPLDHETGEFWQPDKGESVVAHAQCGI